MVRPCFLVNVRKANGRRVAGGRRTERTVTGRMAEVEETLVLVLGFALVAAAAAAAPVRRGLLNGCRGVPKPGEEDGIGFEFGFGFGFGLELGCDSTVVSVIVTLCGSLVYYLIF